MKSSDSSENRHAGTVVVLLLAALAIRAAFVVANYRGITSTQVEDSQLYIAEANRFLEGKPMDLCYRTPGYPLFLAVAGRGNLPFCLLLQALLGIGTCLLTYWGARRCFGNPAAALALLFVAFDMTSIILGNLILTEALFTPLLTGALFLLLRGRSISRAIAAAVLLAAAVYVRPVAAGLAVLWPALLWLSLRAKQSALVFFGVASMLLAPWLFRQKAHCGSFVFTNLQLTHPLFWNAGNVLADVEGVPVETIQERLAKTVPPERYNSTAWKIIASHPFRFAKLYVKATLITLFSPLYRAFGHMFPAAGPLLRVPEVVLACLFWLWLPFTIWPAREKQCLVMLVTALYFIVAGGTTYTGQYRAPAVPALAVCAAVGLSEVLKRRRALQLPAPGSK